MKHTHTHTGAMISEHICSARVYISVLQPALVTTVHHGNNGLQSCWNILWLTPHYFSGNVFIWFLYSPPPKKNTSSFSLSLDQVICTIKKIIVDNNKEKPRQQWGLLWLMHPGIKDVKLYFPSGVFFLPAAAQTTVLNSVVVIQLSLCSPVYSASRCTTPTGT